MHFFLPSVRQDFIGVHLSASLFLSPCFAGRGRRRQKERGRKITESRRPLSDGNNAQILRRAADECLSPYKHDAQASVPDNPLACASCLYADSGRSPKSRRDFDSVG